MFTLNNITKLEDLSGYSVTSNPCPKCGEQVTIEITPDRLYAYNQGAMAQEVLKGYSISIKEHFISGICFDCWDEMM